MTTRGQPEQILPIQLALDPDEFLRRFASRELLYYPREEPQAPTARELLLVVDQGVRTWGDVRLALVAATVALATQGERRKLVLRLATTGNDGETVEASSLDAEGLGELLEASDLSPNPGRALVRALVSDREGDEARDVVLLTHPRSLAEPEVAAAARATGDDDRLFAVAVDPAGEVALSQFRAGAPVVIGRCRVDLADATARRDAPPAPKAPREAAGRWTGEVEPIGFPFRLGALAAFADDQFAFDESGEWLLLAGRQGLLHAWRTDGSDAEMLPRVRIEGETINDVRAVVGVADGFLVAGVAGRQAVAAHYDFRGRTCSAHRLEIVPDVPLRWSYIRRLHSVVGGDASGPRFAIDLAVPASPGVRQRTGEPTSQRASQAFMLAMHGPLEPVVAREGEVAPRRGRLIAFHEGRGEVVTRDDRGEWCRDAPLSDGRPNLAGGKLIQGRWEEGTVALLIEHPDGRRLIHALDASHPGRSLAAHVGPRDLRDFALSRDGRLIALRRGDRQIEVHDIGQAGPPALLTPKGRAHPDLGLALGRHFLAIQTGQCSHLLRWGGGRLEFFRSGNDLDALVRRAFGLRPPWTASRSGINNLPPLDDHRRFHAVAISPGLTAAVDRFGQVAVVGADGGLVAMFLAFRDQIAAWSPDGTRIGPVPMIGGPSTPGAEDRIGAALLAAENFSRRPAP